MAAPVIKIKIEGLEKLRDAMRIAPEKIGRAVSDSMRESAFAVEGEAKRAVTSGPTRALRTGRLRSSIGVESVSAWRAVVSPSVSYAIFVHEGTRYMHPRPFMEVAARSSIQILERIFERSITAAIKEAVAGI